MQILQLLSVLLDYPEQPLVDAKDELTAAITGADISAELKSSLIDFVQARCAMKLLDWQSEYDSLFERGRAVSLLLFEHVHGESRDRGQAMVNLQNQYQEAGLDIGVRELPDYIPLYLEFLSTQGAENAQLGLEEVAHILAVLACRLDERSSNYAAIFHTLLQLSQVPIDLNDLQQKVQKEERDDTAEAMDKVWEEEAVSFLNSTDEDACGSSVNRPSELQRRDQDEFINMDELLNLKPRSPAAI